MSRFRNEINNLINGVAGNIISFFSIHAMTPGDGLYTAGNNL